MSPKGYRILFLSTPVGALGSGVGGGVELTLQNAAKALIARGHQVEIVAPKGSATKVAKLTQIAGRSQASAQMQAGDDPPPVFPLDSVLVNMWRYAGASQQAFDLIFNFAYDWLPLYLTSFFHCPVVHWVSMAALSDEMDRMVSQTVDLNPYAVAVNTRACADTFSAGNRLLVMGKGIDVAQYQFVAQPAKPSLAWVGRVSPEKGLEDAAEVAQRTGLPLHIFGLIQDEDYWEAIQASFPAAQLRYEGFLPTEQLQEKLGRCSALLMTPRWVEAFGNAAIEAFACGVPVISYRSGGLTEIVREGKTGFLVDMGDVKGLVAAVAKIGEISRYACRRQLEEEYSLEVWGARLETWFEQALAHHTAALAVGAL